MTSKPGGKRPSVVSIRLPGNGDATDKPAAKMPLMRNKLSLGNVTVSNQPSWNFSTVVAATRFSKNLKDRRAQKAVKKIEIIEPQPPSFASRPHEKVQMSSIKRILENYLPERIGNMNYDHTKVPTLVKAISEEVRIQVKKVLPARYKLLCVVTMGERGQEDVTVVSRCLWDPHADNFVAQVYENASIFCVVSVYTVFCE
ncbi:dynein light chain Tctex-type protein 2B-like [Hyperolius riggenbachi]|uniref:dynein light chain Tctex-type protein 2B-like n=1 Tax=Hyperolius riggenbachi TaxID=752182 RepID=UPI0035A28A11